MTGLAAEGVVAIAGGIAIVAASRPLARRQTQRLNAAFGWRRSARPTRLAYVGGGVITIAAGVVLVVVYS
jgi:hypothetical protein